MPTHRVSHRLHKVLLCARTLTGYGLAGSDLGTMNARSLVAVGLVALKIALNFRFASGVRTVLRLGT